MTAAADWIARRKALADAATDGPWTPGDWHVWAKGEHGNREVCGMSGHDHLPDAEFIADARTSLPRAVAALDAVLRLAAEYQASPHPSIVAFGREFTATITEHLDAP